MLRRAAILAALAAACARLDGAEAPRLRSIAPAGAYVGQAVDVRLTGAGFQARGVQHLGGGSEVAADFQVRIGGVALTGVQYSREADGSDVLVAHAPADLLPGVHDVIVVDPYGLTGVLPRAFTVSDRTPPLVSLSLSAPAQVETGLSFRAQAQFANAGGVDARVASLQVNGVPADGAGAIVPAGGTLSLEVPLELAARGSAGFEVRAGLVDTVTGLPLTQASAAAQVLALSPPALAATLAPPPASVDVGQDFTVSLTVSNGGDTAANGVMPSVAATGAISAQPVAPQDVPAGESRTWVLPLHGASSAIAQVEVAAAGIDALTGAALATSALSPPIAVQVPAHLQILGVVAPAVVSVGQVFRAEVDVLNDGEAIAAGVGDASPAVPLTTWMGSPAPQALGGSARAAFTWTVRADAAGSARLEAWLAGTDANNSAPVLASASAPLQIQTAAALGVDLALPAQLSTGQRFAVVETVRNGGEAGVLQLALAPPDCGGSALVRAAPALPTSLGGNASVVLSWDFEAVAAGPLDCSAAAQGADANSGQALQASAAAHGAIQAAAALAAASPLAPAAVSRGQTFSASVTITNGGAALARAVSASLSAVPGGGAGLTVVSAPAASDIPGGGAATFTWTLVESGSSAGTLRLTMSAAGTDANSGAALAASSPAASIAVQERAALAVALLTPAALSRGQTFAVAVAVTNTGQATALGVRPAAPQVAASGGASATTASAPPAADIAGGDTATFTFTYAEDGTATGALSFSASAAGTDVNSGATASAAAASPDVPVVTPAALVLADVTLTPSTIDQGQAFTVTATVTNTGQATATSALLSLTRTASGGADAITADSPGAAALAGGASLSVTWNFVETGTAPGTLAFTAGATGSDANSGAALSAQSAPATVTVQAPAALSAALPIAPSVVSRGESFTVSASVSNTGAATARGVSASLGAVAAGGAGLTVLSAPAASDIPGGGAATFTWTCVESGSSAGALRFTASASGADANDGAALAATSPEISVTVQERAALAIALRVPAAVSRGQTFALVAAITNTGGATAVGVQPAIPQVTASGGAAATTASAPPAADIAAGATATFTFTYVENGSGTGTLSFSVSAAGTDANSGAAVSASATTAAVPVMTPAALSLGPVAIAPSPIDRGQAFTVTATVTNTGQAAAAAVTLALTKAPSGGADAITADAAGTVGLAGGASSTFTWNFVEDGTAAGALDFTATAAGTDTNSGSPLSAQSAPGTLVVQAPAALSASLSLPSVVSLGDTVAVVLTVSNTGQASAVSVQPGPLAVSGTAAVTMVATPSPSSATVAGGSSATFTWTLSAGSSGTLQVAASVTGTDANDGASLAASDSASRTVQPQPESTSISTDPFAGDGTNFSYLFSYQGMLYAGPNKSGTAAVRMAPDGSGATQINWKLEVDTTLLNAARNSAYQTPLLSPPCHTIGALGCTQNTTACGPDNEGGRAVFTSGTVNGVEWYLVTGTSPSGSRYAYLTNGSFPLASGGFDDLAFVQIAAGQGSSARMMSAARFAQNQLFVGFYDTGGSSSPPTAPVLNVLRKMPSLPGYQASGGTDLVNLNGVNLPAVGALGNPSNSGHPALMVDALRDFNGSLYVANNGGIARSVGAPTPCAAPGCANWANSTPSGPGWGAEPSIAVDSTALGALDPSKRAVPSMVIFGGRLFAAHNTTAGPQLWSCDPSLGTDPQQCEPGDWSLVARNTSGDQRLSQFNDASNTAIGLLVATAGHLYVGFNNTGGVRIYRTQFPAASTQADFTGHQGCTVGQSGCTGLGGNGLGAALTRLFDGHAFTYAGNEWVYVSAGTGSAGPALFRLAP
ncbi:MAG TPA: hypothetical protein VFL36_06845 [Myxococcales bacterium]|nr:hypothetical protein [Myxococcales bacterium]